MLKRVLLLNTAVFVPVVFLLLFSFVVFKPADASTVHTVIINEWSQGDGGSREWVELLIVEPAVDLRGWDLGDNTAGDLTFSNNVLWESVPAGTLIVIYNGSDKDIMLPADDADLSDQVLILPHNDATYFDGGWPAFSNSTSSDNPHLRDKNEDTVHDFSFAPGGTLHPGSQEAVAYGGQSAEGVASAASWQTIAADLATPGEGNDVVNSGWIESLRVRNENEADLMIDKIGPQSGIAGSSWASTITIHNRGLLTATGVVVTDVLPAELSYVIDSSGVVPLVNDKIVRWEIDTLAPETAVSFQLTTSVSYGAIGWLTNTVSVSTAVTETIVENNVASAVTYVQPDGEAIVLIDAVLYQGQAKNNGQGDEAVALRNVSDLAADVSGWQLSDGAGTAALPTAVLEGGETLWLAKDAEAFQQQFGFWPDYAIVPTGTASALLGSWPGFADAGDEVLLFDEVDQLVDVLVYESGALSQDGWRGAAVEPYKIHSGTAVRGQILYRKRDAVSGLPVADTDTAADWAQDIADPFNGRKVRYPGWLLEPYWQSAQFTNTAVITMAIAPDNAYEVLADEIGRAKESVYIELHTFENIGLAEALSGAAARGVEVIVLLEGGPPGGIDDQQRYACQQLELAGGQCWYMVTDDTVDIYDRYTYMHAKFGVIDGRIGFVSSENFSPNSLPHDDKADGTWGRRGVVLVTDAPDVVTYLYELFAADFDPSTYHDLRRYNTGDSKYGAPPALFIPQPETGGITYTVRYTEPVVLVDQFAFEFVQSPENSTSTASGLLGLLSQAGDGDTILIQQLTERPHWGKNSIDDPNLRLAAYVGAARRGAKVRVLLDGYFDNSTDPLSNTATCRYLVEIAFAERLDLQCAVGNPTGLGIHNKMVLVEINGRGTAHIGSINGTEQSFKGNRELALQVNSDALYGYLAELFFRDWPYQSLLPVVMHELSGPTNHVLISEVLYDPAGLDGSEFVELVNPTVEPIDLSNYSLGDAVDVNQFADVRRFPAGTVLASRAVLVVAQQAVVFEQSFGFKPNFEILETDPAVPNLIDDLGWGDPATFFQLGNSGDVVLLRDGANRIVDVIAYGTANFHPLLTCEAVPTGHSLRRHPYWMDTNDCATDFEVWPLPDPGRLPTGS